MTEEQLIKQILALIQNKGKQKTKSDKKEKQQSFDCFIRLEDGKVRLQYRTSGIKHNLHANCRVVFENGSLKSVERLIG